MTTEGFALKDCIDRHVYRIRSRNLAVGVFRQPTNGFIGIRVKFSDVYLFEEYHNECLSFGTVWPIEDIGILPAEIELREVGPSFCSVCGKEGIYYSEEITARNGARRLAGGEGYVWRDDPDHESALICPNGCENPTSCVQTYGPLFNYLKDIEIGLGVFPDLEGYKDPREYWSRQRQRDEDRRRTR